MSLGYDDFNCICCCKCPWPTVEIDADWSFSSSSDSGCVFTASASGSITKTLNLEREDCESLNEYDEPNGSGSLTVTSGCDNSSGAFNGGGPHSINLISVNFFWDCESKTGTCVITLEFELADPGTPTVDGDLTFTIPIDGNGAGPFEDSQSNDDFSASISLTLDHTP